MHGSGLDCISSREESNCLWSIAMLSCVSSGSLVLLVQWPVIRDRSDALNRFVPIHGHGGHPRRAVKDKTGWPLWAASHSSALLRRLCRAVPSHGPVLDYPFPGEEWVLVPFAPNCGFGANRHGEAGPRWPRARAYGPAHGSRGRR